jgi:hypothetical protein
VEQTGEVGKLEASQKAPPRGAGETILVVEDEDLVRGFACRYLRNEGYVTMRVPTASGRWSCSREKPTRSIWCLPTPSATHERT